MAHNLWVTNVEPAREWTFLSALTARKETDPAPRVEFTTDKVVEIESPQDGKTVVSFDPAVQGDIQVDVEGIRRHAMMTERGLESIDPAESVTIGDDRYQVRWIAREFFDSAWLTRWAYEGDSDIRVEDGQLVARKNNTEHRNLVTLWYREELPPNVIVRFKAKPIPPEEENAANLNLFLHASEMDGGPVVFKRTGSYKEYHQIPNYIVTLTGGCKPGWSRLRKNPGFQLLHEVKDMRSEVGKEYEIAVTCQSGRVRYYINGRKIHDYQDPEPLPGGRFGLRSWSTNGRWWDVEFGELR